MGTMNSFLVTTSCTGTVGETFRVQGGLCGIFRSQLALPLVPDIEPISEYLEYHHYHHK